MTRPRVRPESRIIDPGWSTEPGREWLADAACDGQPLEWFYPDDRRDDTTGKAVCARCPVVAECLTDALAGPQWGDYGIRGGTTAAERERLRGPGRRHCRNGHAVTGANSRLAASGFLVCRDCRRDSDQRRRAGL